MGCAALSSSKGATKAATADDKDAAVTESSVSNPPVAATSSLPTTTSPSASSSPGLKKDEKAKPLDDDDDDEIEIIYEEGPKKIPQPAKEEVLLEKQMANPANAQEPPDAVELDTRPKKPVQAFGGDKPLDSGPPLSKAQQEEAAKLAERRQKFDNQRYQRDSTGGQSDIPALRSSDDTVKASTYGDGGRTSPPAMKFNKPKDHTMVMGLNQGQSGYQGPSGYGGYQNSQQDAFAGLPGGIFDDVEPFSTVPAKNNFKSNTNRHDSFDDEEEQLMREILEDHDGKQAFGGLICDDL